MRTTIAKTTRDADVSASHPAARSVGGRGSRRIGADGEIPDSLGRARRAAAYRRPAIVRIPEPARCRTNESWLVHGGHRGATRREARAIIGSERSATRRLRATTFGVDVTEIARDRESAGVAAWAGDARGGEPIDVALEVRASAWLESLRLVRDAGDVARRPRRRRIGGAARDSRRRGPARLRRPNDDGVPCGDAVSDCGSIGTSTPCASS